MCLPDEWLAIAVVGLVLGVGGLAFSKPIAKRFVRELRANPIGQVNIGLFGPKSVRWVLVGFSLTLFLIGIGLLWSGCR